LKEKEAKRTSNSHWDVAHPTFAPGDENAVVDGSPLFRFLSRKRKKELKALRTAVLLKSTLLFSGMAVPQFEVLC
jgi:hypothetical protein